jgi:hypothetical protein
MDMTIGLNGFHPAKSKELQPQLSPRLMDDLTNRPIPIRGSQIAIALLKRYIELIDAVAEIEHSCDWDLNLTVRYKYESEIVELETEMGFANFEIGDLTIEDEKDLITNHREITNIGFYSPHPEERDPIELVPITWIPLKDIISIHVHCH